ncbi:MAG: T9SS type A sorting domain-containing protein [Bacteroidota bacterium]
MKNKLGILLLLALLCSGQLLAQSLERQVLSPIATNFQSPQIELSGTAGQVGYESYAGSINLSQGFEQGGITGSVSIDEELASKLSYKIYPNPTVDRFNIELQSDVKLEITYVLYDLKGQRIRSSTSPLQVGSSFASKQEVDISDLSEGLYLLVLMQEDQEILKSFRIRKIH